MKKAICLICGKRLYNPSHPSHVKSERHQAALKNQRNDDDLQQPNKYTMKIPIELKDFFQEYIDKNFELGFSKVSQFILYLLQEKVIEIKKELLENKI